MTPLRRLALAFTLAFAAATAAAQPIALPPPPKADLTQQLGAPLPLQAALRDDLGRPVQLGDSFHPGQPVLLVLGYYRCTQLCGLLMHGLLQGLQQTGLPRTDWRIVGVSIDPADTPEDAHRRRQLDLAYARFLQGAQTARTPLQLDLLVGGADQVQTIARAAGYRFQALPARDGERDPGRSEYAHPATVLVVTPEGRISRYLNGIQFDGTQLRLALVDAGGGRVGGWTDRLALLCSHYDPVVGRYSGAVMGGIRALALASLAGVALVAWRRHARREQA